MAWASKKQYAILMSSEEGKDLAEQLPDMEQDAFNDAFSKLLGKGGTSTGMTESKAKEKSVKSEQVNEDRKNNISNDLMDIYESSSEIDAEESDRNKRIHKGAFERLKEKYPDITKEELLEALNDSASGSNDEARGVAESMFDNKEADGNGNTLLEKLKNQDYKWEDEDIDNSFDFLEKTPGAKEKFLNELDNYSSNLFMDDVSDDIRFLVENGTGSAKQLDLEKDGVASTYFKVFNDTFLEDKKLNNDNKNKETNNALKYHTEEDGIEYDDYGMERRTPEQEYLTSRENLSNLYEIYDGDVDMMIEDLRHKDTGMPNGDMQGIVEAFDYKEGEFEPKDNSNYEKVADPREEEMRQYEERMAQQEKDKKNKANKTSKSNPKTLNNDKEASKNYKNGLLNDLTGWAKESRTSNDISRAMEKYYGHNPDSIDKLFNSIDSLDDEDKSLFIEDMKDHFENEILSDDNMKASLNDYLSKKGYSTKNLESLFDYDNPDNLNLFKGDDLEENTSGERNYSYNKRQERLNNKKNKTAMSKLETFAKENGLTLDQIKDLLK